MGDASFICPLPSRGDSFRIFLLFVVDEFIDTKGQPYSLELREIGGPPLISVTHDFKNPHF